MDKPIRIVMADDHEIFRDGFKVLLKRQTELELVGEAENGKELLDVVSRVQPDVAFVDIKMPVMDGIEACKAIRKKFPETRVIALSMFDDDNLVVDMLEAGARGYLLKNTNKNELLMATTAVHDGSTYYCNATSNKLAKMISEGKFNPYRNQAEARLTPRETEIIKLICEQQSNKEIAASLKISTRTVETHRERIYEKIDAKNSIGILIYAIKHEIFKI